MQREPFRMGSHKGGSDSSLESATGYHRRQAMTRLALTLLLVALAAVGVAWWVRIVVWLVS